MQTQILLENMSGKTNFIGQPVKAVAYNSHKTNKRLNTISIHTTNFTGRIWIQGSLKSEPKNDEDWFNIPLTESIYKEYYNFDPVIVKRKNDYFNLEGSFVWLRAKLDRSYLKIVQSPFVPYDFKSERYIITSNVDINPNQSHNPYKQAQLNPKYDPEYYDGWNPNYLNAYERRMSISQLGNVEKIMLCY